jgi:hypothetical protein
VAFYGLTFDEIIFDRDITNKATARIAARAKLAEYSIVTPAIRFVTMQHGLRSGQIVRVTNEQQGVDGLFLTHEVKTDFLNGGFASYSVTVGTYNLDLIGLIFALTRRRPVPDWDTDGSLDEVFLANEALTLAESFDTDSSQDPYYFSEDPAEAFIWGFGTFSP